MVIDRQNMILFFICMLFFGLYNQAFFSFIFDGTIFLYWKQIIPLVCLPFLLTKTISDFKYKWFLIYIFILFLYFFITMIISNGEVQSLVYKYCGFLYFSLVFVLVSSFNSEYRSKLKVFLLFLCFFVSIGVIFDSFIPISDMFSVRDFDLLSDDDLFIRRPAFFLGSSSVIYLVLIVPILLGFDSKIVTVYSVFSIVSIYLSGSRFSFVLYLLTFLSYYFLRVDLKFLNKVIIIFIISLILFFVFINMHDLDATGRFTSIFDASDSGNVGRFGYYAWFSQYMFILPENKILFGEFLGYLSSEYNIYPSTHFESSFISVYIETGVVGVLISYVLFNVFIIFSRRINSLIRVFFVLIFVQSLVVPSFMNYVSMSVMGLVYGMSIAESEERNHVY